MQHATQISLRNETPTAAAPRPFAPSSARDASPRGGLRRALQTAAALMLAGLGAIAGCGSAEPVTPPFCVGGFVRKAPTATEAGVCEGKCDPAACGADQVCVDNHCALTCTSHQDCGSLGQACLTAKDDSEKDVFTCQSNGEGTIGIKCPFGNECAGTWTCDGTGTACDPKCTGAACPCTPDKCNSPVSAFACPDGKACDPKCTGDKCACTQDKCNALYCRTAGAGDAEAFCTLRDCQGDDSCPGGYWCAPVRIPNQVCGTMKGNDANTCGPVTTDPCVDPTQNMANGTTYSEGTLCGFRNECRIRRQCATCETDLDCSALDGYHCTTFAMDGTKACTRDCAMDTDCEVGFACTSGGCTPRYGSCVGTGKYCEPCRNDTECGAGLACLSYGGAERMCMSVTMDCTTDADCPTGADGRHGMCANAALGLSSTDSRFDKCFFPPQNAGSGRLSCWCSNLGTACMVKADCCSGKCIGAVPSQQIPGECK
jgi:hypothetical protein